MHHLEMTAIKMANTTPVISTKESLLIVTPTEHLTPVTSRMAPNLIAIRMAYLIVAKGESLLTVTTMASPMSVIFLLVTALIVMEMAFSMTAIFSMGFLKIAI